MQSCPVLTQRNLVGLVKATMNPKSVLRNNVWQVVLCIMKYFAKHDVNTHYKTIFKFVGVFLILYWLKCMRI